MDYVVHKDPKLLESTGYMEIGPGKYSGKHWQDGFLFIWSDAFSILEGVFEEHFPQYDNLDMNDIPRGPGLKIVNELKSAAALFPTASFQQAVTALRLPAWLEADFIEDFANHRDEMQLMIQEVSSMLEQAYQSEDFACVLGM